MRPPSPSFISANDVSITVGVLFSLDDHGIPIEKHELEIDEGDNFDSAFTTLSYDGTSETYLIDLSAKPPRTTYRIRSRAKNVDGVYSEYSDFLIVS